MVMQVMVVIRKQSVNLMVPEGNPEWVWKIWRRRKSEYEIGFASLN
jgi:hypothetical protein